MNRFRTLAAFLIGASLGLLSPASTLAEPEDDLDDEEPAAGAVRSEPSTAPTPSRPSEGPATVRYTLRQLVDMARDHYPGVAAAQHAVAQMEAKLYRARWAWVPQGRVTGLLAPAPSIHCFDHEGKPSETSCVETDAYDAASVDIGGVLMRIEVELAMPLFTFDKLGAARRAAEAGVELRRAQVATARDRVAMDVTKAYWGLKLAREIIYTIEEGREYLVKGQKQVEEELDSGEGEATMEDLLRIKVAFAEVDARLLEARKLERLTQVGLAILTGRRDRPFDVDTTVIDVLPGELLPLSTYRELTRLHRPDMKSLAAALKAANAAVDLERARFFPDFLLVGSAGVGYTSSVEDPKNAFYSDPFNFLGAGFGLAMSWQWDQLQQVGRHREAKAQAREVEARREEALAGIDMELNKARVELEEAMQRLEVARRGEGLARKWLTVVSQNMAAGLAETKDLTDALVSFFTMKLKTLQAIYDVNVGWAELGRVIGTPVRERPSGTAASSPPKPGTAVNDR